MLVLSLTYYNVITMHPFILLSSLYIFFMWPFINSYPKTRKPNFDSINNPITYCCELDGSFSGCVSLYYWFIVARYLGLFQPLSPIWRPRGKFSHCLEPEISEPRKPPDRYRRGCLVLLSFYLYIVFLNTNAVYSQEMSLRSLSALPLTLFSGFFYQAMHRRETAKAIGILFAPNKSIHDGPFFADPFIQLPTDGCPPSDATKLSMLSAWQSANARSPIYMDYAPGSKAICIDTGASSCISNDKNDFISLESVQNQSIAGIGSGLSIEGVGTLRWKINDDDGNAIILHVQNALYVPKVPMCLLCPQQVAQQTANAKDGFHAEANFGKLTYDGFTRTIPYSGRNGLPIVFTAGNVFGPSAMFSPLSVSEVPSTSAYAASLLSTHVAYTGELNLSRTQRLLLLVHASMAHLHLDEVQRLARAGYFGDSLRCIGSCDKPKCRACCIGKAHQRTISTNGTPLKAEHLRPGDCISSDQLESNAPGRIAVWKGKISTTFYHACTFFIDHASNKVHITLNYSTGAEEAVSAKRRFEQMAAEHNVQIKRYHADNGIYASKIFKSSCEALNQTYDFSGVGAKHQNGVAERMIGTITRRARSMLAHATILWPEIISDELWPFALKMAVDVHNSTPGSSGLSPTEIFSGQKSSRCRLRDFHPFGCPVFVLEASLQNGHKIPKWKPRSRMAIYLGNSPDHATYLFLWSSIPLPV